MNIQGQDWRTIWLEAGGTSIGVIDQTKLPHKFITRSIGNLEEVTEAIRSMVVRGAPLIGVTGAYGLMLALQKDTSDESLAKAFSKLLSTRPTAVNLSWALERVTKLVKALPTEQRAEAAKKEAQAIAEEDVLRCEAIGDHGLKVLKHISGYESFKEQHKNQYFKGYICRL